MSQSKNLNIRRAIWSGLGITQGIYMILQGPNAVSFISGVMLSSVSVLIAVDAFRESIIENAAFEVFGFFTEQKRRVSALYTIYKMAPDIAAARESYLLAAPNAANNAVLPPPEPVSEGRAQMWRQVAEADSRIEWVTYADANLKNLKLGLLTSDVYARIQSEHTLILTDIGSSEVNANQLRDYVSNKISLSFWIAKKMIGDCDLLVVQRNTLSEEGDTVSRVLRRLTEEYQKVLVFVHADTEQNIKGTFVPSSEQVINSSSILE